MAASQSGEIRAQAVTVVLIPKVAAEVAILVGKTSAKILSLLKRLFAAISACASCCGSDTGADTLDGKAAVSPHQHPEVIDNAR
ncbi:hypothetical protein [Mangrovihabitans endophyticus]|uniref:Uncharacterized protein n=1 Tax=Mangrovihabitans endophyticus TaxID=1751298 RepID=A0A8J3C8P8_9ACTN|nr:hypothetical protein [Mangrovihabitans endophyticus]GGL18922.1 hypothetical protein GCM10012284_61860 [Mangrovihabitans endophyticus]